MGWSVTKRRLFTIHPFHKSLHGLSIAIPNHTNSFHPKIRAILLHFRNSTYIIPMIEFFESTRKQFRYYKILGYKTVERLTFDELVKSPDSKSNSIAVIVNHLRGNMLSRRSNFLSLDGEKPWRDRDSEFDQPFSTRAEIMEAWEEGWNTLFQAIDPLDDNQLDTVVRIRNQEHTVIEAVNKQLAHSSYHIGQIVYLGRLLSKEWESLSIPKGASEAYNQKKFNDDKKKRHYTDDLPGN